MKKKTIITLTLIIFSFINANSQTTITLQPNGDLGKDALLHGLSSEEYKNYGDNPQLAANAWTFQGIPGVVRSAFDFDLSAIPSGAKINSAYLSLYAWDSTTGFEQHSALSGSNECWLQRITSTWYERTVNWTTQPTTTTTNQVAIPMSSKPTQDYLDIDVSNLVQDMVDNPSTSFGFLLRLQNESHHRRMNFASSDHSNKELHPKLVITYSKTNAIRKNTEHTFEFNLFPNPASNSIAINLNELQAEIAFIEILSHTGQLIAQKTDIESTTSMDLSAYSKGLYFVKVYADDLVSTKKLIIE